MLLATPRRSPRTSPAVVGDLFIWQLPNAGTPQKAQRYAWDWAVALRDMLALGPELLLPAHGPAVAGRERVALVLGETARALESLHEQVIAMMNAGARLDDIIHTVKLPDDLRDRPWLRATYDEPELVVRNVWRLYGGWYDGNPAHLKPARDAALAREVAALAGGAAALASRAEALAAEGELRLACHLAEMAAQAAPDDATVRAVRAAPPRRRSWRAASTPPRPRRRPRHRRFRLIHDTAVTPGAPRAHTVKVCTSPSAPSCSSPATRSPS